MLLSAVDETDVLDEENQYQPSNIAQSQICRFRRIISKQQLHPPRFRRLGNIWIIRIGCQQGSSAFQVAALPILYVHKRLLFYSYNYETVAVYERIKSEVQQPEKQNCLAGIQSVLLKKLLYMIFREYISLSLPLYIWTSV